jgi:MFS family permease
VSGLKLGQAIRTRTFALLYAASLLTSAALYVPFVFLPAFAHNRGAGQVAAAALVGLIGAASIVGRLGLATLADRFGSIRLYQLSFLTLGLSYGIWLGANSYGWLVVFTIIMGIGYGGYVGLSPAVTAEFFGIEGLGRVLGTFYTSAGFGALIGPPLAGLIIDRTGSYRWAIVMALTMAMAAFCALLPLQGHSLMKSPVPEFD